MAAAPRAWAGSIASIALGSLLLAGCASPPGAPSYPEGRGVGAYRVGEPYEIKGVWYYPAVDYNYDRIGVASWYGQEFEGRLTANGEIFDLNGLTAAHTTLPMPSIVQVTNLENGRSLQLRVNDRGPFVDGRLIDVSRRAAQLLGFESQGTTRVRVTVLKEESIAAAEEAMHNSGEVMVAEASGSGLSGPPTIRPAPIYTPSAVRPEARNPAMAPTRPEIEPRRSPPAQIAAMPREPASVPPQVPEIAMARVEPPAPRPASSRAASSTAMTIAAAEPPSAAPARYRFSLIARAEAAELPPVRTPERKSGIAATPARVMRMPPSPPRGAASARMPAGGIYIQAGAFSRRDNAERAQSKIAGLGRVQVTSASIRGIAMYRVRVGPFASQTQASRLLARIVDSGYPGARIVGE